MIAADRARFLACGWTRFPAHPATLAWAQAAAPVAARVAADPALHPRDLRCDGTWFAGVNALPNGPDGAIGGAALAGPAVDFVREALGLRRFDWDRAQVSVVHPGYPRHGAEESAAAFAFRRDRDAAHVDGLLREGPERRRFLGETHLFILGVPLSETAEGAAPLVVWEGSHRLMREALRAALAEVAPEDWARTDITEAYVAARRRCFAELPRLEVTARPGEAYLVHRLALHGVAAWRAGPGPSRAVAYLRPTPPAALGAGWTLDAD